MIASSSPGSLAKKWRSILLNKVNSTFFGSTKTNLTCAGCFLYRMEIRMAFKPTDLPCPVAPATNKWGILVRSNTYVSLVMVLPMTIGNSPSKCWNLSEAMSERIETISGLEFGTSIPMVPFPGIGAMMRMPSAERLSAMSSSRFLILEMRTPGAGTIS